MFKADSDQVLQPPPRAASRVGVPWSSIDSSAASVACTSPPGMVSKFPDLLLPPGAASSGARSGKPFDPDSEVVGYAPVLRDPKHGLFIQDTVEDETKSKVSLRPMVKNIDGM